MPKRAKKAFIRKNDYPVLLADLKDILETGRAHAEAAVKQTLLNTYWHLGARLAESERSDTTMSRLAQDLELDRAALYKTIAFARTYPDGPPQSGLGWTHYRALLSVNDDAMRERYAKAARDQKWTARELAEQIKRKRFARLTAKEKRERKQLVRPTDSNYVYRAEFVRAVDGDTVILRVDLGFYVLAEHRMRLAGIDAPDLSRKSGKQAQALIDKILKAAGTIAIKTHRIDRYGRYVAHVFTMKKADQEAKIVFINGVYLNATLVTEGLARKL